MFTDSAQPRLFAEPIGVDFLQAFIAGLDTRLQGHPPEAMARVTIIVNTRRMARRLEQALAEKGPGFLPRLRVVSDIASLLPPGATLPKSASPLRLQLHLSGLVGRLLDAAPELSPRSAAFDLAGSLADLVTEFQEEGLTADALAQVQAGDLSEHWDRSLQFLRIVGAYLLNPDSPAPLMTAAARQELALCALADHWANAPPKDPVIVAGSTGSRRPTLRLMQMVAQLPQGAIVLPGLDADMPDSLWKHMGDTPVPAEDHPQYRYVSLLRELGVDRAQVTQWSALTPAAPARNRLISLALRPAPVTNQWRSEGGGLGPLDTATEGLTMVLAANPREEAATIALRLRAAVQDGRRVALISPDRMLTRQVTAALDRWGIEPDDSAGRPLGLSAAGRLIRHAAGLRTGPLTAEGLLVVLKHPLTATGDPQKRGIHLLRTRALEIGLLREGCPFPTSDLIAHWGAQQPDAEGFSEWLQWLTTLADTLATPAEKQPLEQHLEAHLALLADLSRGPTTPPGEDRLWSGKDGQQASTIMAGLAEDADEADDMTAQDYANLITTLLAAGEVRDPNKPHPDVMIWGAMEARVQGADLVILGGLNDGIWPKLPDPDPWLNRSMRRDIGLQVPDRRIGLSAHDFQQAIGGKEVWLTRSVRNAEAETVPSRWLNRLTNLLRGLGDAGQQALDDMIAEGDKWRAQARALEKAKAQTPPAPRPAPAPPIAARPTRLSVTAIERLIRNPYDIYARYILGLRALPALRQTPDAPMRGSVVHDVMAAFTQRTLAGLPADGGLSDLIEVLDAELEAQVPWPAARRFWRARFARVAPWFLENEAQRRAVGTPSVIEDKGGVDFTAPPFKLTAKADRIDVLNSGDLVIYDYKTGTPPTKKQEKIFSRQLLLEAVIAEAGGFVGLGPKQTQSVCYIGLGSTPKEVATALTPDAIATERADFVTLIARYADPDHPYLTRQFPEVDRFVGDYDHLSRYGEWDETVASTPMQVGQ